MKMKKILWALLSVLLVSGMLALTACGGGGGGTDDKDPGTKDPGITDDTDDTDDEEEAITTFTVTFETGCGINPDGTEDLVIKEGETVPRVDEDQFVFDTKDVKAGFYFDGWYSDKEFTKKWNFSTGITNDITLYAHWLPETVNLNYTLVGSEYRLDGPSGSVTYSNGSLVIPAYHSEGSNYYPVTIISTDAFNNQINIEKVYLPSTILHIKQGAFSGCPVDKVYIRANNPPDAPAIDNDNIGIFWPNDNAISMRIYVPVGSKVLYDSDDLDAEKIGWLDYAGAYIETD
ncbi:MAG: InlB B-repeat-containing protein [Spirochaetes bacterium]|nr:InlB B-repeat-containing protein [Spirochaetota bacterium]MBN2772074.1 InlB B-repeat-containing protein [Spirochaetota bacterium]